jgi:hypothetical protein
VVYEVQNFLIPLMLPQFWHNKPQPQLYT